MLKTVIMMATSLLLMTCPGPQDFEERVVFKNKSDKFIGLQAKVLRCPVVGEDTLLQRSPAILGVKPDTMRVVLVTQSADWDDCQSVPAHLQVLVLNIENYQKYWSAPLDTVRKYVPVLDRYVFTHDDLERLNWIVTYPPTPEMKKLLARNKLSATR